MSALGLLPGHHTEFKSKEYWDRFFLERENKAFEWYGNYTELKSLLKSRAGAKVTDCILVIGCGNSNFSSDLYDDSFRNVTSNDFSQLVIDEMVSKNSATRPDMCWDVMDMTEMTYPEGSMDLVLDKGALDALMSDASAESHAKAKAMFTSIARTLSKKGKYVCVTLAESFIFKALLEFFASESGSGDAKEYWSVTVDVVRGERPSPFLPLFVTVQLCDKGTERRQVFVSFDPATGAELSSLYGMSISEAAERVPRLQEYTQKQFDMGLIHPGRFENMDLWSTKESSVPRFTILILDCEERRQERTCAVFFVPRGREAEYQFSTESGLGNIAQQASCRRLFAVRCNRPHEFGSNTELQDELSQFIHSLRPWEMATRPEETIPYMAIQADEGWETLEADTSDVSGPYIVEEKEVEGRSDAVMRRLVFLQNQGFVQTETRLVIKRAKGGGGSAKSKAKGKGKGKSKPKPKEKEKEKKDKEGAGQDYAPIDDFEFDFSYLDYHHRCFLASIVLSPSIIRRACSSLSGGSSTVQKSVEGPVQMVIVGFAGGAICMSAQKYLPQAHLLACDLDGDSQNRLARVFFGFKPAARTRVVQGEGVTMLKEMFHANKTDGGRTGQGEVERERERESREGGIQSLSLKEDGDGQNSKAVDILFIDADCKDSSLGMSAPPAAFVTPEMLQVMYDLLSDEGMLVINVVARMESLLHALAIEVREVFCGTGTDGQEKGAVYIIRADEETVNVVLVAVKGGTDRREGPVGVGGSHSRSSARWHTLDSWLKAVGMAADPLELREQLDKIEPVPTAHSTVGTDTTTTVFHGSSCSLDDQD